MSSIQPISLVAASEDIITKKKNLLETMTSRNDENLCRSKSHENGDDDAEGLVVAIRCRPLSVKRETFKKSNPFGAGRVWRVSPFVENSIEQTLSDGQPSSERVIGRNFFTFDKIFGENATTRQVYDEVAKTIVQSSLRGVHGTIFSYGQTSSGKTFTMQGNQEEGGSTQGIVHMAAMDIFNHIKSCRDRVFQVRVSFIEIYNEEVRDLIGENKTVYVRENAKRGVVDLVNATELVVFDFESLIAVLGIGQNNRTIGPTRMNERSSRSHTVFRLSIESQQKPPRTKSKHRDVDVGPTLMAVLNLVDLAGSESPRSSRVTGTRKREGGKINRSLTTLSRVIDALGRPNRPHISFRDSKLTFILKSSLSGTARLAVVCCITPSEAFLEESRSTLQFAARAKLVETNAQVNEHLDEKALVKQLQLKLAEAHRQCAELMEMSIRTQKPEPVKNMVPMRDAEEKVKRLRTLLVCRSGLIPDAPQIIGSAMFNKDEAGLSRRFSDGDLFLSKSDSENPFKHRENFNLNQNGQLLMHHGPPDDLPQSLSNPSWEGSEREGRRSSESELEFFRAAFHAKSDLALSLQQRSDKYRAQRDEAAYECSVLAGKLTTLAATLDAVLESKNAKIDRLQKKLDAVTNFYRAESKVHHDKHSGNLNVDKQRDSASDATDYDQLTSEPSQSKSHDKHGFVQETSVNAKSVRVEAMSTCQESQSYDSIESRDEIQEDSREIQESPHSVIKYEYVERSSSSGVSEKKTVSWWDTFLGSGLSVE